MKRWRVGAKVKLNVYDGDRPVCQCHNEQDASRIAAALNHFDECCAIAPAQPCGTCGGTKRVTPPIHMSCMWLPCSDCSASSQGSE